MRIAAASAFLVALVFGQVPPPPAQTQPAPQTAGSGFISGHVVDAVCGKPIPEATVLLNGRLTGVMAGGRGAAPAPLTGSQGRFVSSALTPGLYSTQVQKPGNSPAPFGTIELADAERVLDWKLKLAKYASISGTLRDETGEPAVGVDISLFRRAVQNGRQSWQFSGRARSDDRGAFRFSGLNAGDMVVCACSRDPIPFDPLLLTTLGSEPVQLMSAAARALSMGADAVSLDTTLRTWAPTFY